MLKYRALAIPLSILTALGLGACGDASDSGSALAPGIEAALPSVSPDATFDALFERPQVSEDRTDVLAMAMDDVDWDHARAVGSSDDVSYWVTSSADDVCLVALLTSVPSSQVGFHACQSQAKWQRTGVTLTGSSTVGDITAKLVAQLPGTVPPGWHAVGKLLLVRDT